ETKPATMPPTRRKGMNISFSIWRNPSRARCAAQVPPEYPHGLTGNHASARVPIEHAARAEARLGDEAGTPPAAAERRRRADRGRGRRGDGVGGGPAVGA